MPLSKKFVSEAIKNFKSIGALFPTNRSAIKKMISMANLEAGYNIAETGTGDGIVTMEVVKCIENGKVLGIELNKQLFNHALNRIKNSPYRNRVILVNGDAHNLKEYAQQNHMYPLDVVFSCVPIVFFKNPVEYLLCIKKALRKNGVLLQITYRSQITKNYFQKAGLEDIEVKRVLLNFLVPGAIIKGVNR